MSLVASFRLSREHRDYQTALVLLIASLACNLIERAVSGGGASVVLSVVQSVCSLGEIYFFIRATNSFLSLAEREDKVQQGWKIFRIELIACVIGVVLGVLIVLLAENVTLVLVLALAAGIVSLVPAVLFIQYLKDSADILSRIRFRGRAAQRMPAARPCTHPPAGNARGHTADPLLPRRTGCLPEYSLPL